MPRFASGCFDGFNPFRREVNVEKEYDECLDYFGIVYFVKSESRHLVFQLLQFL